VTRDRLYIETMQQVFSNVSKVYLDSRSGSSLLYLPLDKLLQPGAPAPGVAAGTAPAGVDIPTPSQAVTPAVADPRTRDASRSRDREGR
jgi:membrane protease subunit HflK